MGFVLQQEINQASQPTRSLIKMTAIWKSYLAQRHFNVHILQNNGLAKVKHDSVGFQKHPFTLYTSSTAAISVAENGVIIINMVMFMNSFCQVIFDQS